MATEEERRALLSVPCPWCGAVPSEECYSGTRKPIPGRKAVRRPLRTLDGGAHDARWQVAVGYGARVVALV